MRTDEALARWNALPPRAAAFASAAVACVLAPLMANDVKQDWPLLLSDIPAVISTSTLPEAGTVKVTAGPGLAGVKTVV